MQYQNLFDHLNEIVTIDESEFEDISSFFKLVHRKKNQFLIQAGSDVQHEYFVIKGLLKSSVYDESGREHIIQFAMENWWITDYYAFINKEKAELNIDCLEDCELLSISFEQKDELTAKNHKMERFWSKKTKNGYASLQNRILSLIKDPAVKRYEDLVKRYPQLIQRVPKKYIASFLGVSRETLSRLY